MNSCVSLQAVSRHDAAVSLAKKNLNSNNHYNQDKKAEEKSYWRYEPIKSHNKIMKALEAYQRFCQDLESDLTQLEGIDAFA